MPYYGMPVGLQRDGVAVPEVGFGYKSAILQGLLDLFQVQVSRLGTPQSCGFDAVTCGE